MRTKYNVRTGVTRIKSKAKRFTNKLTFGVAAGVASIGLAIIPMAAAATTTVTPSNMQGWAKTEANSGSGANGTINFVPSTGADGAGAAEFTTPDSGSYTRLRKDYNLKLSDINTLSYNTKQVSGTANTADVNLRLYIDTNADGTFDDVLVFEPSYTDTITPNVWQTWNGITGFWWSNSQTAYNGSPAAPPAGSYATNFHLSDVTAQYPNANVVSIGLGTGDSNSPWVVQADDLVVNDTTYNFEPNASTVKVTIDKYIDGVKATALTANNSSFPMESTWSTTNIGSGTGNYNLGPAGSNSANPYEAVTSDMSQGANYTTHEITGGSVVAASCTVGGAPYALVGYSTGSTLAAAETAAKSNTAPAFTGLQSDQFVIVWNKTCPPAPTHPTNKDQCKDNGWKTLVDASNRPFKNQGDCVSYVATNGKNKANG